MNKGGHGLTFDEGAQIDIEGVKFLYQDPTMYVQRLYISFMLSTGALTLQEASM